MLGFTVQGSLELGFALAFRAFGREGLQGVWCWWVGLPREPNIP